MLLNNALKLLFYDLEGFLFGVPLLHVFFLFMNKHTGGVRKSHAAATQSLERSLDGHILDLRKLPVKLFNKLHLFSLATIKMSKISPAQITSEGTGSKHPAEFPTAELASYSVGNVFHC